MFHHYYREKSRGHVVKVKDRYVSFGYFFLLFRKRNNILLSYTKPEFSAFMSVPELSHGAREIF